MSAHRSRRYRVPSVLAEAAATSTVQLLTLAWSVDVSRARILRLHFNLKLAPAGPLFFYVLPNGLRTNTYVTGVEGNTAAAAKLSPAAATDGCLIGVSGETRGQLAGTCTVFHRTGIGPRAFLVSSAMFDGATPQAARSQHIGSWWNETTTPLSSLVIRNDAAGGNVNWCLSGSEAWLEAVW